MLGILALESLRPVVPLRDTSKDIVKYFIYCLSKFVPSLFVAFL